MTTLATRARLLREYAGIGQREADRLADVTRGLSGSIEREEVESPRAEALLSLSALYGVSIEWLLSGKGEEPDRRAVARAVADRRTDRAEVRS